MSKVKDITLLVDAGVNTPEIGQKLLEIGSSKVIVGTKHLGNIKEGLSLMERIGLDNVIFTVEMEQYQLYTDSDEIRRVDPIDLINQLQEFEVKEFIIFELANIGTLRGVLGISLSSYAKFLNNVEEYELLLVEEYVM